MKKIVFSTSLILLGLALVWYMFIFQSGKFDTKPFEAKIDSLQQDIDSIHLINDTLELGILVDSSALL